MPTIPRAPREVLYGREIQAAIQFAAQKHSGQFRKRPKNGIYLPFILHPLEVAKVVWQWEATNREIVLASILHDTLEATNASEEEIKHMFGEGTLALVDELTLRVPEEASLDEEEAMKKEYIDSFEKKSIGAVIIKVADRLCNVCDFVATDPKYAKEYFGKAKNLFITLKKRIPEIEKQWGEGVAENIVASVRKIKNDLSCDWS